MKIFFLTLKYIRPKQYPILTLVIEDYVLSSRLATYYMPLIYKLKNIDAI